MTMQSLVSLAMWCAALGQFGLIAVSVQVPGRLGWRRQLPLLDDANRRLYVVATGYVVFTYLGFAVLTLAMHDDFVRGGRLATGLSIFIGLYWLVRVVVVEGIFRGAPWPDGLRFRFAHAVLDVAFACLAVAYLGTAAWHLLR
jgi:hypothetical protein